MVQPRKKGFTLIELIIGITILALLAVGLLAALDPAEQFAKARDTSTRNTLLEIYGAFQRYEAAQEKYPTDVNALTAGTGAAASSVASGFNIKNSILDLIASGELKPNFESAAGTALSKIFVYKDANGKIMTCYKPTAKSFKIAAGLFTIPSNAPVLGSSAPVIPLPTPVTCTGVPAAAGTPGIPAGTGTTICANNDTVPGNRECCVYCAQ